MRDKMTLRNAAIALGASLALSACTLNAVSPETALFSANRVNPAGANGLVALPEPRIGTADLALQICPTIDDVASKPNAPPEASTRMLVGALNCFNKAAEADPTPAGLVMRRNAVQDYMIMWSNQNCALWVTYLERAGALNRGTFNVLSVLTGGVGAMVTGNAARALSGSSSIASGTGAAVDAAMLHGLTEGLILPRVAAARATKLADLYSHRRDDLTVYPMTRALADVLNYHATCNISSALQADTPAAQFGQQLDQMLASAGKVAALRAVTAGAHPPTLEDVSASAIFLDGKNAVLQITSAPKDSSGDQTVSYKIVSSGTTASVATPSAFLALVANGLALKPQ